MALRITRRSDYATRIIYHLTCLTPQQRTTAKSIAKALGISLAVTNSVITQLALAGLVQTTRGSRGGVTLAHDPTEVSLLEVVEAIEGPIVLHECIPGLDESESSEDTTLCLAWREAQAALVSQLRQATFDQLCSHTAAEKTA